MKWNALFFKSFFDKVTNIAELTIGC